LVQVNPPAAKTKVKVLVVFPLGTGEPYKADEDPETTVGEVLAAALAHFGLSAEPGSRYLLGFGPKIEEPGESQTLESLDEGKPGKGTLKFTLVKELIQG
jgi:hypothetical protein